MSQEQYYTGADDTIDTMDSMEDIQMYDEEQLSSDPVENIDIQGLVPEYEPVEITPVGNVTNSYSDEEDDDDEEGFNDAEEITDDMLDSDQAAPANVEDIKIEPDINIAMMQQYM